MRGQVSAVMSARSARRCRYLVRPWVVSVPRWSSRYISPTQTGSVGVVLDRGVGLGEPVGDLGRAQARAPRGSRRTGAGGRASPRSGRRRRRRSRRRAGSRGWRACRGSSSRSRGSARGAGLGVVAADRVVEGVREHPAAVEALPPEEVVGHDVGLGPVHLDGEEAGDAGEVQELRQRRREAEAVGEPADGVARCRTSSRSSAGRRGAGGRSISPVGMLVSGSTHIAPVGSHWPAATFSLMRSRSCGVVLLEEGVELGGRVR